jgi:melanoma-associated antigen
MRSLAKREKVWAFYMRCTAPDSIPRLVTSSSKTYILRSILPASLMEASLEHDPEIRNAAHENRDEDDDEEDTTIRPDDTLVAWRAGDDLATIGILHVILALILVNGRSLPDRT